MEQKKLPISIEPNQSAHQDIIVKVCKAHGVRSLELTTRHIALMSDCISEYIAQRPGSGAVWVKGDYDRLYDRLKADVNCRVACYVDYDTRIKNEDGSPYILRDICSIWGENMEFGSRGHGYGSVRFMPGDEKTNFIALCIEMNVEWLCEGTAAGREEDAVDADELWDEHAEYIDDNIDELVRWAGSTVVTREQFNKMMAKFKQKEK